MNLEVQSDRDPEPLCTSGDLPGSQPDELPSLPGFSKWRSVYWFILAAFILYIVLMQVFQGFFS